MVAESGGFATAVVKWQARFGRNDLPWQQVNDPYHVWLSEIMLQQTQVATVRAYFQRFIDQCPTVESLAVASLDEVMGLWSGLGYYSRARNLHRCAQEVMQRFGGAFPRTVVELSSLPGIGRSTAAAIASLCFGAREAILDANVKRVLTRVEGFDADLSVAANERTLWTLAESRLPQRSASMRGYTQGMMDLGATVCLPRKPLCDECPVRAYCVAVTKGDPQRYPVRTRKVKRSSASLWLLLARTAGGAVCLSKRPAPGVWAGLYCLPLFESAEALQAEVPEHQHSALFHQPAFVHVLTHKDLHLHVVALEGAGESIGVDRGEWFSPAQWQSLGLPAPVRKILEHLTRIS